MGGAAFSACILPVFMSLSLNTGSSEYELRPQSVSKVIKVTLSIDDFEQPITRPLCSPPHPPRASLAATTAQTCLQSLPQSAFPPSRSHLMKGAAASCTSLNSAACHSTSVASSITSMPYLYRGGRGRVRVRVRVRIILVFVLALGLVLGLGLGFGLGLGLWLGLGLGLG